MPDSGRSEPAPLAAVHRIEHAVEQVIASTERTLAQRCGAGALRGLRLCAKTLFIALLVAYFAAGTLFLLARHVWLPRIDEQREHIERLLTRELGAPVHIGRIAAHWHGWNPTVKVTDLRILDSAGNTRFGLGQIEGTLSWLSVSTLEPRFTALHLLAPELDVRRLGDGRLVVAGFVLDPKQGGGDRNALDWLLEQGRVVIRDARLRIADEPAAREYVFSEVNLDLQRSLGGQRRFALQARAPGELAGAVDLRMEFRVPAFTRASRVASWSGRVYASFEYADLAAVQRALLLLPSPIRLDNAQGALRLWVEFDDLRAERVTADVALANVETQLGPNLEPLRLANARGRLALRDSGTSERGELELALSGVSLQPMGGAAMPPLDARLRLVRRAAVAERRGEFDAGHMVLQDLAALAAHLPLPAGLRDVLARHQPSGELDAVRATWQGDPEAPERYSLRTRFTALGIRHHEAGQPGAVAGTAAGRPPLGTPSFENLSGSVEATDAGGTLRIAARDASLQFPGVFAAPRLSFARLNTVAHWITAPALEVRIESFNARNEDVEAEVNGIWRSSDAGPGSIDLNGRIARAVAPAAYKYLPLVLPETTREWLQRALLAGEAYDGTLRLRGDLRQFPFVRQDSGEFRIAARVRGGALDPVPGALSGSTAATGAKPVPAWAPINDIEGTLLFERNRMEITARSARIFDVRLANVGARINEFTRDARLRVQGDVQGPLADVLRYLVASPVNDRLGGLFTAARGSGAVRGDLKLDIPLTSSATRPTEVAGSVNFGANELDLRGEIPPLGRLTGRLEFTEKSLRLAGATADALGGSTRLDIATRSDGTIAINAAGSATSAGVRGATALAPLQRLLERAQGSTRYALAVALSGGRTELRIDSDLVGWALDAPAPLRKAAPDPMPLSVQIAALDAERDSIRVALTNIGSARFDRHIDPVNGNVRIERGTIGIGEAPPLPDSGVSALISLPRLDADRWLDLLEGGERARGGSTGGGAAALSEALPNRIALQVRELIVSGKPLANVVVGASRADNGQWQANVVSDQINGQVTWRPSRGDGPGVVRARLTRLSLPETQREQLTGLLDAPPTAPADMPALDILADEFELGKLRLGRLELQARNVRAGAGRSWQLQKLEIANPDGRMSATGSWEREPGTTATAARRMNLALDVEFGNAGRLLARLGIPDAIRNGTGSLKGDVSWLGSPFSIDYPSLAGKLQLQTDKGQFLKADAGAARLLGVMSLQSLPRRITLDFRDVFSEGFAFDVIGGSATIANGALDTRDFRMRGVSATVLMEGSIDLGRETQNLHVLVLPHIDATSASLVYAAVANPAIGLGTFLAQLVLRDPLSKALAVEYDVTGAWADPHVKKRERAVTQNNPEGR